MEILQHGLKTLLVGPCSMALVGWMLIAPSQGETWQAAVRQIKLAAAEPADAEALQRAWKTVAAAPTAELPQLLASLDDSQVLPANWIRSAIDAVVERAAASGEPLPIAELKIYLANTSHNPRGRRMAFELLSAADADFAAGWLPTALNDPSLEIRRDAVAQLLDEAQVAENSADTSTATHALQRAFAAARDEDQIKQASDQLKELGKPADVTRHYGFITTWKIIGPFDNRGGKGFSVAYPPEIEQDAPSHEIPGKNGSIVWREHHTDNEMGEVDLNAALGKEMGAVAYAFAQFYSDQPQPVDLRLGSVNANKIWLNGQLLHEAEIYHALTKLDQYIARGKLKAGRNTILLKICQNEQTDSWAQDWKFQFRVCDETGGAILSKTPSH